MTEGADRGAGQDPYDALAEHIGAARWFGGKGRSFRVENVTELGWLNAPGRWPAVRTEIVELGYPQVAGHSEADETPVGGPDDKTDSAPEFYQLLMAYYPPSELDQASTPIRRITDPEAGDLVGVDGAYDAEARRIVLIRLLGGYAGTGDAGSISFRLCDQADLGADLPSTVFGGQQSNTSIMYGEVAMLKLFRRLELGRNLDIEAHQVFSDAKLGNVARLYGWLEGTWSTSGGVRHTADFGMLVEKLADATDGWEFALEQLNAGRSFTDEAAALGAALREIHHALAANFATSTISGDEVAEVMNARLAAAVQTAPALAEHAAGLRRRFDALRGRELAAQRVHGDFHLGQTLHTPQGWKIIDFEGEPAKTMAERVAPDAVWRDVAGLLRSFDYAAASRTDVEESTAQSWAAECQQAVLTGYRGTGENDHDDDHVLIDAYVAEKAVYEVVYETRNRPDWVHIPLAATARLAGS